MKTRRFITGLFMILMATCVNAQFFKKLAKKAEQAAERTVLNRTDREVSKGTDKAIDSITKGGNGKRESKNIGETEKNLDQGTQESALQSRMANIMGAMGLDDVPDVYEFSYRVKMKLTSQKDETVMNYLFQPGERYFGNEIDQGKTHSISVMDLENESMVMFNTNGEQKTAMKMPLDKMTIDKMIQKMEEENVNTSDDVKIVPIANKTILGYRCKGYQITSKDGISKVWITNEAPVGYMGGMIQTEKLPNVALPIDEKTMFMEMQFESQKRKKDNFRMICTEIKEQDIFLAKNEYTSLGGFQN
ncbi:DUF4412 domain-containing protein [Maribacter cobaltidurans]|uniref:Uncharacterized protein n=1 Tax=Maribacter cobaltidurans TaxID=1178778 RepID=A0A223V2T6_9FLAO|nr:DUF4412 domain-containing protein [Maribacter cobaltidurans]ASV29743.1 hypothetical protein CJ263_05645 [Maribacter cobaltidurans]GGD92951.1 hypothetical protein GCM10011412_33620 [Maribacter cobaltidurans]